MVERDKQGNRARSDIILSGVLNFATFYFFISLYDIFINYEPAVSGPRALVSVFAVGCIYFLSNGYYSILNKIRTFRDENSDS